MDPWDMLEAALNMVMGPGVVLLGLFLCFWRKPLAAAGCTDPRRWPDGPLGVQPTLVKKGSD